MTVNLNKTCEHIFHSPESLPFDFALCFEAPRVLWGPSSDSATRPLPSSVASLSDDSASRLGASLGELHSALGGSKSLALARIPWLVSGCSNPDITVLSL